MLILLRHGESEANAASELVGRKDSPLTELGANQAAAAARHLATKPPGSAPLHPTVFSSPLARARATAEIVAGELGAKAVVRDERLIELDYGAFDGLVASQVSREDWAAWRADAAWRPPGGESLYEVQARVSSFCEEMAGVAAEEDVIAVSHVSPIKAAASWALGAGPELSWRLLLGVATITRVSTSPRSLRSFGETGHLVSLGR